MLSYIALGDSYTIGEQVPFNLNFPNTAARLLAQAGTPTQDPVIIATTGWTTDELAAAIRERNIQGQFDVATLLIGVNNQYRGRSVEEFRPEFLSLLHTAIHYAQGVAARVFVLSIPDWGVTPFAEGKDRAAIAAQIDAYNAACQEISLVNGCHYIEITESTRANGSNPQFLAEDGLHPSAAEYEIWAHRLANKMMQQLASE